VDDLKAWDWLLARYVNMQTPVVPKKNLTWEETVRRCMSDPDMADLAKAAYFDDPVMAAHRYEASAEFQEIRRIIPSKPGRALDLGAGNGILSWALARNGWDVTAVEPDQSSLIGAEAIRKVSAATQTPINVVEAFGESIPISDAGFDLIVARQVLHHAQDLPAFCREMARLSRPGAMVLTLRDHVITNAAQKQIFLETHPLHRFYGGENAFKLSEYETAFDGAGIKLDKRYVSFQSVLNFDPASPEEIFRKVASLFGVASGFAGGVLRLLPPSIVLSLLALTDRRPGRLVSYVGYVG
jgi:2-polyprenyl-3-methyl-5-hydroxy-6-metoxy-1,4-benzoquinol methylase